MKEKLGPFNLFSYKINFTYNNSNQFHSLLSLLTSLVVYCLIVLLLFQFSQNFIYKKNPQLNYREREFMKIEVPSGFLLKSFEIELDIKVSRKEEAIQKTIMTESILTLKIF